MDRPPNKEGRRSGRTVRMLKDAIAQAREEECYVIIITPCAHVAHHINAEFRKWVGYSEVEIIKGDLRYKMGGSTIEFWFPAKGADKFLGIRKLCTFTDHSFWELTPHKDERAWQEYHRLTAIAERSHH